ncbi:hypothetical protein RRG08_033737 [Elysia crispata]|uniref:Uncharacterized protein n=1 Tax=Elysia crispata TaxID=231223 RepID=A0AAE1DV46_9GAST|nr:hypothetical protein RRG08_033737 [Elysia crispata]
MAPSPAVTTKHASPAREDLSVQYSTHFLLGAARENETSTFSSEPLGRVRRFIDGAQDLLNKEQKRPVIDTGFYRQRHSSLRGSDHGEARVMAHFGLSPFDMAAHAPFLW